LFLLALGGVPTFALFVLKLPEIHDAAHWRRRLRGNFHEIEAGLLCAAQGLG
jgi:hypothetical protein